MRMQKKQFRIGHLAKELGVDNFVIRFWEKEFGLSPNRSRGGQRFYSEKDVTTFKKIKDLLYSRGFTISGAKKELSDKKKPSQQVLGSHKTTMQQPAELTSKLTTECKQLKKRLLELETLLS